MIKTNTKICGTAAALVFILAANVYAGGYREGTRDNLALVNTLSLDLGGVKTLILDSADEELILRESKTGELAVREYMSENHSRYYARVSRGGDTVTIRRGRRPWFNLGWEARMEIDIPRSFRENIKITNGSGIVQAETELRDYQNIDISVSSGWASFMGLSGETVSVRVSSGRLDVEGIRGNAFISVSSGSLRIGALTGGEYRFRGSSGNSLIARLQGKIEGHVSSGNLTVGDFSGEGSFTITSGKIDLDARKLLGDLRINVSSGQVDLAVPEDLSFNLDAVITSGGVRVMTSGDDTIRVSGNSTVLRPIGPNPAQTIYVKTSSGSVNIRRGL